MTDQLFLRILLPHAIFLEESGVVNVQVETPDGSYGFLPRRLDGTAALNPGLITYVKADGSEHHIAIDQGVLVKAGNGISIAVRNAVSSTDLGELHKNINEKFRKLDDLEQESRNVLSHLETGFVRNFEKLIVD